MLGVYATERGFLAVLFLAPGLHSVENDMRETEKNEVPRATNLRDFQHGSQTIKRTWRAYVSRQLLHCE